MSGGTTRPGAAVGLGTAAAVCLLLAGCGGGSGSGGSDESGPSETVTTAAATAPTGATASATQAARPDAPEFDLPSGLTADFKGFKSGDANTQAALTDATYAATAILEFQGKTYTTETPNFKRFWSGPKGAGYADTIVSEGRDGNVITGAYHYYKPVVKSLQGGHVSVRYCEDQRKGYLKDPRTGKVFVTTPALKDFRLWTLAMAKGSGGDWQVYDYTWVKGSKACQVA
ncbi:hypothetical protein [Streptomyces sp. CA-111067]|uniref:hypothetical protein n=1 Tax=Streptomyces sp. CA-111067 TaxID=3240046 RepID=UPI003D951A1D